MKKVTIVVAAIAALIRTSAFAVLFALIIACGALLPGCGVVLPNLNSIPNSQPDQKNPYSVSINEVVKRVKCEIWLSIKDRPEKTYPWFNKWVVQADLTLTVNDSSGLNPGATFIQPLNVANTSRSLGIGGGVTNTAFRTEIVSFSISVAELRKQFEKPTDKMLADYNDCYPYGIADLTGNLGLVEWVNSSFGPIDNGLLKEGTHPAPKAPTGTQGGAPPPPPPPPPPGVNPETKLHEFMEKATTTLPLPKPDNFAPNLIRSIDLSPLSHPAMRRVVASFEPCWLGGATGRGAEPSV